MSAAVVLHAVGDNTLSAVTMLAQIEEVRCRPWWCFRNRSKYSVARESTPSCSIGYSVARESSSSSGGSILSAVTMFPQKEEVLCLPSDCFTLRLGLELEKKLIVNIVSLDLIKHRVNEQKEFLVSRRYAHFSFRQCKVTNILGDNGQK